jgi:hypothetical protein
MILRREITSDFLDNALFETPELDVLKHFCTHAFSCCLLYV